MIEEDTEASNQHEVVLAVLQAVAKRCCCVPAKKHNPEDLKEYIKLLHDECRRYLILCDSETI